MTTDNVNPRCVYTGASTREIVFPLGGIGTGSIGLGGNGRLTDWEIDGRPHKGAINDYSHLAVKAAAGGRLLCAKVLAGDLYKDLAGAYGKGNFAGYGYGPQRESLAGFPHFREHTFIRCPASCPVHLLHDAGGAGGSPGFLRVSPARLRIGRVRPGSAGA